MEKSVPYIVYEGEQARNERTIKRLIVALIVTIVLLFLSNAFWLYYESQFETISYQQDGTGLNNINTGAQGDILNGAKGCDKEAEVGNSEKNPN